MISLKNSELHKWLLVGRSDVGAANRRAAAQNSISARGNSTRQANVACVNMLSVLLESFGEEVQYCSQSGRIRLQYAVSILHSCHPCPTHLTFLPLSFHDSYFSLFCDLTGEKQKQNATASSPKSYEKQAAVQTEGSREKTTPTSNGNH